MLSTVLGVTTLPDPLPVEHPYESTNTITRKGVDFTLGSNMKVGYALNGQPFIVSDQAGTWTACDAAAGGAMFDPQLIDGPGLEQGFSTNIANLSGAQAAAVIAYDAGLNIRPETSGAFAITEGMCGRIVLLVDKAVPSGWQNFDERIFINVVPEVPPYGAICPIFDGLGGVQWVARSTVNKGVLAGCGYVTGQETLATCLAGGYLPDPDQPFFFTNGEQRRPFLANSIWTNGYGGEYGDYWGRTLRAMHSEGAGSVDDDDFYALLTIGCYGVENARRGNVMRGGAGQNLGMKPLAVTAAMATRDPDICADALLLEGNSTHQQFRVTEDFVGIATNYPGGSGTGYQYRWTFQDAHVGRDHFFHGNQALPPDPTVDTGLYDADTPERYEITSGSVGCIEIGNYAALKNGPGGVDGLTFLLDGGGYDADTNPKAAFLGYWERYFSFNSNMSSLTEYTSVDKLFYNLVRDTSVVPRITTTPDPVNPYYNQSNYLQFNSTNITWDYTSYGGATETVTQVDHFYTLDGGRTFLADDNCGESGTFGVSAANPPRGVDIGVQNVRYSASGAGPQSVNKEKTTASGSLSNTRFVGQVSGTPSGTPTNTQAPEIRQKTFDDFVGDLYRTADATVAVGTVLYAGKGWWTGDLTGGFTYSWKVEGVEVGTGSTYTTQSGDASIELVDTCGGVSASASNVVNNVALAFTSATTKSVAENATLSHSLTATRPATYAIRTSAQDAASVDYSHFEISGSTLRWLSNGTKDYESPGDTGSNNTYVVVVRATNAYTGQTVDQTITVTVTDVVEGSETYYNFNVVSTNLSAISGWTRESAEERLQTNSGGTALRRLGTTATAHFYREGVNTSGTQRAEMLFSATGTATPHIVVFGTWSGGAFTGYAMYPSSATVFALRKYVNGVGSTLTTITVAATAAAFQFEAHDTGGGSVELKVYNSSGVQQGSTYTDSASPITSGYNGIYLEGNSSSTTAVADDFRGNMQF